MRTCKLWAVIVLCGLALNAGAADFSWQNPYAKVLPNGDLAWAPVPFTFKKGTEARYIDYEKGDDNNDGKTTATAWKHHPWDKRASGMATRAGGPITYVFKRGVIYRGHLRAKESGRPGNPIILTCDPNWGQGLAEFYGSKRFKGGWNKCRAPEKKKEEMTPDDFLNDDDEDDLMLGDLALVTEDAPGIPEPGKVWYKDLGLDFDADKGSVKLSNLWLLDGEKVRRIHIARDPNWRIVDPDDPFTEWYTWQHFTGLMGSGWIVDERWKGKSPVYFKGVTIWSQHRHLMGTPHMLRIQGFNYQTGGFKISTPGGGQFGPGYGGDATKPHNLGKRVHYYMEGARAFLDSAGEYYFDTDGLNKGRLYIRLEPGVDPNTFIFEAGQIRSMIEIRDQNHIEISNLSFSFNDSDDGDYGYPWFVWASPGVRIVGSCKAIHVHHCRFYNIMNGIVAFPRPSGEGSSADLRARDIGRFKNDVMGDIVITDNDIRNNEGDGAISVNGESEKRPGQPFAKLENVTILRNRVINAGYRPGKSPTSAIQAIKVILPVICEIAGNFVDTSWGSGIFTMGGKSSGAVNEVKVARILIHHNKVENTMLGCNDYGGLEIFQGGPAYFYNNISRNAVGSKTFTGHELAYNLYLDGAFKVYSFNNILAGKIKPDKPGYYGHCGYFMVFGFLNQLFNNTIHRFEYGLNGSSGNRSCILGNIMVDCQKSFMGQNRPGDISMMGGGDTGEMGRMGIATMVYGDNLFWGHPKGGYKGKGNFGFVGGTSLQGEAKVYAGDTLEELSQALAGMNARVSSLGVYTEDMPLHDPMKKDYRPVSQSAVKDLGVKFFVPWGVARVVGEWHFYKSDQNPTVVLGENFYMQDEHLHRAMYYFIPRNDLMVNACTAADYIDGPLEDWIEGALSFNGKSRCAVLAHAELIKDMTYPKDKEAKDFVTYDGKRRKTVDMDTNNFLIEIMFKADKGKGNGAMVCKRDVESGYSLGVDASGALLLELIANGKTATVKGPKVNDGVWCHLVVEVDRATDMAVMYLNGKQVHSDALKLGPNASLANQADFVVGKGYRNDFFAGAMDFLRISRGTLADAQTNIDELYAWQFNGPFLRDFTGRKPVGRRDAGALEIE